MLKIYNTATRKKEEFVPINPTEITMYNCGLTVYDRAQIGNLRAYTMADTIRRGLEFLGYNVKQVQNFTDVGHLTFTEEQKQALKQQTDITDSETGIDRMEKAAKKTGMTVWEVAQYYIDLAMKDFAEMNFEEPFARPRATDYIEEQKDLIKTLLEKDLAYITETAIYFDTAKFPNYGELTGQKLSEKKVGVREEVEIDPTKRNPFDFRLWQLDQKDHAMQWDFEYEGKNLRGFPGWHLECSAMIHKILGHPIDIHTGGVDHISVHHTNEIAQSEGAWGHPFVKYWMHNEFLQVDGRKMGKSLGNAYNLDDIKDIKEKGFSAMDLRYFYLTASFRFQQNLTWEALEAAKSARKSLIDFVSNSEESTVNQEWLEKFKIAVEDSFNMPQAIATVWEMISDKSLSKEEKVSTIREFDKVLGLKLFDQVAEVINPEIQSKLEVLITRRNEAKVAKDFTTADQLREEAKQLGFELEDTKDGTIYKKI
jgi:cysteinyl-tRNA synthetase